MMDPRRACLRIQAIQRQDTSARISIANELNRRWFGCGSRGCVAGFGRAGCFDCETLVQFAKQVLADQPVLVRWAMQVLSHGNFHRAKLLLSLLFPVFGFFEM